MVRCSERGKQKKRCSKRCREAHTHTHASPKRASHQWSAAGPAKRLATHGYKEAYFYRDCLTSSSSCCSEMQKCPALQDALQAGVEAEAHQEKPTSTMDGSLHPSRPRNSPVITHSWNATSVLDGFHHWFPLALYALIHVLIINRFPDPHI